MGFIKEFKEFAMRGNVIDLAVGVVIGGAFGKIVTSLVDDLIMPVIGVITGGVDFSEKVITLKEAVLNPDGSVLNPAVTLNYGNFINVVIQFLIIAFCIFVVIKALNSLKKKDEAPADAPAPAPSNEEVLLTEIRDLLKNK
ncbi:large-conductance mechanosensitive channel protein MscL [Sphingobacterium sp. SGL-16]|uniref:large-conductance mechanosensitive channel protein MscL n=1 Tax=Sphingobacterium sp. SGL-16 TaxID=2710883 RepID=UPI0013EA559C|nr:large-conductance mechanosensitive channel protein MscL [Sphingobacterium sp. SGL-16]NGM73367.1 large-conductance mechanosensitive channel protein MscL [Sphingobacterium sp. SGL-16]